MLSVLVLSHFISLLQGPNPRPEKIQGGWDQKEGLGFANEGHGDMERKEAVLRTACSTGQAV